MADASGPGRKNEIDVTNILQLDLKRYTCQRCGAAVHELHNVGQWQCSMLGRSRRNGLPVKFRCDHGKLNTEGGGVTVVAVSVASQLPKFPSADRIEPVRDPQSGALLALAVQRIDPVPVPLT